MKKQQQKLRFTKSKIAHFKTLHLFGGTDASTNPYSNVTISVIDCHDTIVISCHELGCSTHGRPRTNEDSPCGKSLEGLHTHTDCLSVSANC
ncbi:hypothetical protein [Kordia sp.]|uniref:hypothetical protein n=1 Tax=Kordia sp. TaxID=1965332 RepID=UPI003D269007